MGGEKYSNPTILPSTPADWGVSAIEELCERVTSGGTPLRSDSSYYEGGTHSWFKTKELKDSILFEAEEKITDRALDFTSAKLFPKDTVLMAMYGDGKTITSLGILGREAATNQACCAMIPERTRCEPRFLFYALKYHRGDFLQIASGGAQRNLSGGLIRRFAINVPPLEEQRAIAYILGTLDDKIELNRRMNETLEAMARALFKSWFVDFDPVRAKVEGRDTGLPKEIADLFPSRFVESELGEVPEGWGAAAVGDLSSLNPEAWSKETRPAIINYVDLSNTKWGRIETVTLYARQDAPSRAQRVLRPNDTIVGTVRPGNGSYAFIADDGLTGSTGFAVLRPLKIEYAEFVYFAATAVENIETLSHLADGGAYPAVRTEVVAATQVVKADDAVVERYSLITRPLLAKMAENERESSILAAMRDSLLPKLISGEVRVKDVECVLEARA
ncbi:MAG: restriction endonuclease subunit S [Proteobacteria bacterium]|jgi:type I restriction enzyme S subunit|nr:restriction endonuclease subunit S [Pseudomonadota bacterium]